MILAEKKDACYSKVRSRYKVWPSAYASGALVQCRKKGAANWGNSKNEGVTEGRDSEELADEVYAEFERIYPNLARRADERTIHAAIIDVLNYGGDSNPSALAQDVARAVKRDMQQGVAEGNYDRDDYYNARQGREYGKGLTATGYGGDGSATRRDDIFKGQSKRLPADPFARTSGAVPTAGTGRIHSTAHPDEMDEGEKVGNMDADRFDDAMARLKKLAGAGPMKTVYDPNTRRYKNVPTAVQPKQQPSK
jgi:hypothetical protein